MSQPLGSIRSGWWGHFCLHASRAERIANRIMPFSSFRDPPDLDRAQNALEELWRRIKPVIEDRHQQREHDRLVYLVASFNLAAHDEEDLIQRVWERYWQR
jgi:hypothetical protein